MTTELRAQLEQNGTRFVECSVSDFSSNARGKTATTADFFNNGGCRMASVVLGMTLTGQTPPDVLGELLPSAYDDVDLRPDLTTLRPQVGRPGAATVLCEPHGRLRAERSGRTFDANDLSPRAALRRTLERLRAQGIAALAAPELELYLLIRHRDAEGDRVDAAPSRPGSPAREVACEADSVERAGYFAAYFDELHDACQVLGIPMAGYAHESAFGQFEVNFQPGDPLVQADAVFRFKRIARRIAERHGCLASFIAKPFLDQPGCGMHWHYSLRFLADGSNVFLSLPGQPGLGGHAPEAAAAAAGSAEPAADSIRLKHFVAGLQRHAPAMMAFLAPFDHSYDRIRRADSSPSRADWGVDNRMAAFRVPRSSAANRRIENRLPGGDANPYLTCALTLGLGLAGMMAQWPALDQGPQLPGSLAEALAALDSDAVVRELLGDPLVDLYLSMKRCESAARNAVADPRRQWDFPNLLEQA